MRAFSSSGLRRLVVVCLLGAGAALAVFGCGVGSGGVRPEPAPRPAAAADIPQLADVVVTVPHRGLRLVPASFLGLSTEYWTLPFDERHVTLFRRVLSLIHVAGDQPLVLRVGGDSSDHTFYAPRIRRLPDWAFGLTLGYIQRTARVVRQMQLRVILDLNLATGTPQLAQSWVREAEAVLPRHSILGFEVGNEPDLYNRQFWQQATGTQPFGRRVLAAKLGPAEYVSEFKAYADAVSAVVPHPALFGPAVSNAGAGRPWIRALLAARHPDLRVVTAHRYPYARCAFVGSPWYPTIARILSERATAGMAVSVHRSAVLAHRKGLRFRLTEFNSVTCGGVAGISDSFATALWAPDAVFELVRAGAQGVNLHARQHTVNDPFAFDAQGLRAHPLLYGLILFARTLGPHARLVPLRVQAPRFPHVKVWGVKVGRRTLHVLVLNKGARTITVELRVPGAHSASIERLTAPAPGARSGERLAGQWLDANAQWRGPRSVQRVAASGSAIRFSVPRYSAALVASGALVR